MCLETNLMTCGYCGVTCRAADIRQRIDGGRTPLCPACGIDDMLDGVVPLPEVDRRSRYWHGLWSPPSSWRHRFSALHVETTGDNARNPRALRVALGDTSWPTAVWTLNPGAFPSEPVTAATVCRGDGVVDADPFAEFANAIEHSLRHVLVVSCNAAVEVEFLRLSFEHAGRTFPFVWAHVDIADPAERRFGTRRLDEIARHLGVACPSHRLEDSVVTIARCFTDLVRMEQLGDNVDELRDWAGAPRAATLNSGVGRVRFRR